MEQQKALELASTKWEAQLNKLNYAISSINLYLGRDEEIVCIQERGSGPGRRAHLDPADDIVHGRGDHPLHGRGRD